MTINEIRKIAEKYEDEYEYVAIRTQEEPFEIGVIEHVSSLWDNGDETEVKLNGISGTMVKSEAVQMHCDKGYRYGHYFGDHHAIICGNRAEYGDDVGEVVISDAVVVEVLS